MIPEVADEEGFKSKRKIRAHMLVFRHKVSLEI